MDTDWPGLGHVTVLESGMPLALPESPGPRVRERQMSRGKSGHSCQKEGEIGHRQGKQMSDTLRNENSLTSDLKVCCVCGVELMELIKSLFSNWKGW